MAKRKRLTPALFAAKTDPNAAVETYSRPPIAQVAGEAAEHAAFAEVAQTLAAAREEGRLIQRLPLGEIETGHLIRDRMAFDADEMAALCGSLKARGQQVPIEVVAREEGDYGLISGLRRVLALREIGAEEVLALIRQPETSADAYLAMIEENEIRAGISFYERARLAAEAARLGIYPDASTAIAALFGSASPAKRSKIGSFVRVHEVLGADLRFPAAIPERIGLALAGAIDRDVGFADRLRIDLNTADPAAPESERKVLDTALAQTKAVSPQSGKPGRPRKTEAASKRTVSGITIEAGPGRVVLTGQGVTEGFFGELEQWITKIQHPSGD